MPSWGPHGSPPKPAQEGTRKSQGVTLKAQGCDLEGTRKAQEWTLKAQEGTWRGR